MAAATHCIERDGLEGARIAVVAEEVGVSPQTIYRYFRGEEALAKGVAHRIARLQCDKIKSRLETIPSLADKAVEAVMLIGEESPVLALLLETNVHRELLHDATQGFVLEMHCDAFESLTQAACWSAEEALVKTDTILRFALSLGVSPGAYNEPSLKRAYLHKILVPALGLRATDDTS